MLEKYPQLREEWEAATQKEGEKVRKVSDLSDEVAWQCLVGGRGVERLGGWVFPGGGGG